MGSVHLVSEKDKNLFASKKNRYIALGCILGLALFFLFRGCSLSETLEKEYTIGQDSRWRGTNLMGNERNLSAFNNDLLAAIAKQGKFRIRFIVTPTTELLPNLEQGKLQAILTTLQPSYLHENRLIFSDPYFLTGPVLIIPATAPIEGWNEKAKKIVGILPNSPVFLNLEQDPSIQLKLFLEKDPSIQIQLYDDTLKALSDLSARRIDGALIPAIPAYTYVRTFYKNELKVVTLPLSEEGVRLVALKNEEGELLIKHFNEGLAALKQNGTYKKMLEQWGLIDVEQMAP